MGGQLKDDVRELLRGLEAAQRDLLLLQERKRTALSQGAGSDLLQIAREETVLSNRLRELVDRRALILNEARNRGAADTGSLAGFVATLPVADREDLQLRIEQVRTRAETIRRETWVQWIIAHRAYSHYSSMLELIAHSGAKSPTYEEQPMAESTGGALLDASI